MMFMFYRSCTNGSDSSDFMTTFRSSGSISLFTINYLLINLSSFWKYFSDSPAIVSTSYCDLTCSIMLSAQ